MRWITVETFAHPSNESFFSIMVAARRSHIILWYESQSALLQGDVLHINRKMISINKGPDIIILLNSMPFTRELWRNIRNYSDNAA